MASRIIKFDGIESNYINEKQLGLTVKLTPTQYGQTSYEDVFAALDKAGLKASDILGLYKVSQNDSSYCLFVGNEDVLNSLMEERIIGENKAKFNIISMAEQTVRLKIHWLPLYYDKRLLKAIFCDYGKCWMCICVGRHMHQFVL